jgi:hypothetical protein
MKSRFAIILGAFGITVFCTQARAADPDCLAGLPQDISMSELTMMKFDFGARTFPPGQRCTADMVMSYDSSDPVARPTIRCQLCMGVSYNDARAVGEREVDKMLPNELGDVRFFFKNKTDVNTAMKLSCKTEDTPRNLGRLFQTPSSAKNFLSRLKEKLNISCTQLPLPPEAKLRPNGGGSGTRIQ